MKKLKDKKGMTLTEMLCAVIVMLLVANLLTIGVRFAVKSYKLSMAEAQAQTLCSTLNAVITDKLRFSVTDRTGAPLAKSDFDVKLVNYRK